MLLNYHQDMQKVTGLKDGESLHDAAKVIMTTLFETLCGRYNEELGVNIHLNALCLAIVYRICQNTRVNIIGIYGQELQAAWRLAVDGDAPSDDPEAVLVKGLPVSADPHENARYKQACYVLEAKGLVRLGSPITLILGEAAQAVHDKYAPKTAISNYAEAFKAALARRKDESLSPLFGLLPTVKRTTSLAKRAIAYMGPEGATWAQEMARRVRRYD